MPAIKTIIFEHDGEEWIATVGQHLKMSDGKKVDAAVITRIVHDRDKLYRVYTTALPGVSHWENPFLATVEDSDVGY
jgi:hypothetical protein